jgi:hypothetical protein
MFINISFSKIDSLNIIKSSDFKGVVKKLDIYIKKYIHKSKIILLLKTLFILLGLFFFKVLKTGKAPWWHANEKITVANPVKKSRSELKDLVISIQFA